MLMMLDKEAKKQLKEAQRKIIWEAQQRKKLVNEKTDYAYLQMLLNRINDNPNLTITIIKKDGEKIILQHKYEKQEGLFDGFNGEPATEEIR